MQDLRLTPTTRSSSNSLTDVHELEISASGRLSVYELQTTDVGQNVLRQTSQTGVLVSPDVALEDVGEQFIAVHTKGDGGCALHAVWGVPSVTDSLVLARGQLEGRKECCAMLSDTWHGAKM